MQLDTSFGQWLKRLRRELDLTQDELARRVGCATATIQKIEADERRPSRQIAERLADCLELTGSARDTFLRMARARPPASTPSPPARLAAQALGERNLAEREPGIARGYELRERLGAGGFGAVYRAEQPGIGREVAVKIILPQSTPTTPTSSAASRPRRRSSRGWSTRISSRSTTTGASRTAPTW